MNVRLHIVLLDEEKLQHDRSIMFMECSHELPDDVDLAEFARALRVVATVQDPLNSEHDAEVILEP